MVCKNCGAQTVGGALFCGKCVTIPDGAAATRGADGGGEDAAAGGQPPGSSQTTAWQLLTRKGTASPDIGLKVAVIAAIVVMGLLVWAASTGAFH